MKNLTDSQYFAHPAVDQTQLKQFAANPREWAYSRLHPEESKTSPAFQFGTAFHAYLMGTGTVISPDGVNLRTKAGQAWRKEQEAAGSIVVSPDDMQLIQRMVSNLEPDDRQLISQAACEQAYLITDRETGLQLKIKPDVNPQDPTLIVDVKTTADNSNEGFTRSIVNFGYDIQAVFYTDVLRTLGVKDASRFEFWCWNKTGSGDYRKWSLPVGLESDSVNFPLMRAARSRVRETLDLMAGMMELYTVHTLDDLAHALWADSEGAHTAHEPAFSVWQERKLLAVD